MERSSLEVSKLLQKALKPSGVYDVAPSIGIPLLMPDGKTVLRGPRINVPEVVGHSTCVEIDSEEQLDRWIKKGWIDLRVQNVDLWRSRFQKMIEARAILRNLGSASASIHTYLGDSFEIGEVVAWIFNNELGGFRVK